MEGCFVEFTSQSDSDLLRTIECVNYVATLKRDDSLDDEQMAKELSASERAFFREPTPEELREWNAFWFSTPVPQRHSREQRDFRALVMGLVPIQDPVTDH